MDNDKIIDDFLKTLRIAINNSAIYFVKHPVFLASVDDLRKKITLLFSQMNPLRIGITAHSLFIGDKYWDKNKLYEEIAEIFHRRRLKNIEFKEGINVQELAFFLEQIAVSPSDILKRGGLGNVFKQNNIRFILVEELDYSQLLKGEGDECKDVWEVLLRNTVEEENPQEINEFVDNFDKIMTVFKTEDLLENTELQKNINKFLFYLKENDKDKYRRCTRELIRKIVKDKTIAKKITIDKLKIFFNDVTEDDFAETLLKELKEDENFDSLSFHVFSQLIEGDKQQGVASALKQKIGHDVLRTDPNMRKKIESLFSVSASPFISEMYRRTLSAFLNDISSGGTFSFDQNITNKNYLFVLLNLLAFERDKEELHEIVEMLLGEWDKITENKNLDYMKSLLQLIAQKRGETVFFESISFELERRLSMHIEGLILEGEITSDFPLECLRKNFINRQSYIEKIFKEKKVNCAVLYLYFTFFPHDLAHFKKYLRENISDVRFIKTVIETLAVINVRQSFEVLKYLFSFPNNFMRIKLVHAMGKLSYYDERFLFLILKKQKALLKREALAAFVRDAKTKNKVIQYMLLPFNCFGIKNKMVYENLEIMKEMNWRDAKGSVKCLAQRKFFWNRKIRSYAKEILKEWDNGNN